MSNAQAKIIIDVLNERRAQDLKWGIQNHDPVVYSAILTEEVGEVAKAATELFFGLNGTTVDHVRQEAVQVAAVAMAIIECLDRNQWKFPVRQDLSS